MNSPTPFHPSFLLSGPHRQTLWPPLLRQKESLERHRERLKLEDGDFLDLDWCGSNEHSPLVVLLHGLTGSSNSKYILGLQQQLFNQGWQSVAVNFRSCSGEPNHLARSYHSGDSAELDQILVEMSSRFPNRPMAAVGYSLGGNVLLKYLGEQSRNCPLTCAVAVSVPFRLDICAAKMNTGLSRIYRDNFLKELYQQAQDKIELFQSKGWNEEAQRLTSLINGSRVKTFEEFDHSITAPLHGFKSGSDYYQQSSSRYYLQDIARPTLIIHSEDDPFMTPQALPRKEELSQDICFELTSAGGHVGFIQGSILRPEFWLEERIPAFLNSYFPP
ncbi:hydrolase [Endozoicomonas numazuensis]|uniref:Alpha/beta hydrolase n=1 Tax=Endozoicomonas numazuensis TaxID=1137799 RepID=A0A081NLL3_9GAMM|nr:hydrolase [Endozoicomonas numazuensis]KEQ19336.1 alpha/beta hydrolase [Endozoicomonas numazuensis]